MARATAAEREARMDSSMDRSGDFRQAAADCLMLARTTADPLLRTTLLDLAQKWIDLVRSQDDDRERAQGHI